jgi:hypothetical protein
MTNEAKLSDAAAAFLWCVFQSPKATLRYANIENKPSPQARAALGELCKAGILSRVNDGRAEVYALTEAGQAMERRPRGGKAFIEKHGWFPLAVPRKEVRW